MSSPTVRVLASAKETGQALSRDLEGARSVSLAVAFAKPSAWDAVDLRAWCAPERSLRLVVGTDFAITDLDVLRDLVEREDSVVAYVGSSNLTLGGLATNIEANVRIEGRPDADRRAAFEGGLRADRGLAG